MMKNKLDNQHAVVTGGASGIGAAIVERFVSEGATVTVIDRDAGVADELVRRLGAGDRLHFFECDVADFDAVHRVAAQAETALGHVTVLVNNAGIAHIGKAHTTKPEDMRRVCAVNIEGVYHWLHAVLPGMAERKKGVVLNMCSIAAKVGIPDRFAYSLTKGAVLSMTRSVACDYLADGIRCNCVCPARVHTSFVDRYLQDNYPGKENEMFEQLSATQPIGRMGRPDEIAGLAVYLCSEESGFVTGAAYDIDGGFVPLCP